MEAVLVEHRAADAAVPATVLAQTGAMRQRQVKARSHGDEELGIRHKYWPGALGALAHTPAPGPPALRKPAEALLSAARALETSIAAAAKGAFAKWCCEAAMPSSPTLTVSSCKAFRNASEATGKHIAAQGLTATSALAAEGRDA